MKKRLCAIILVFAVVFGTVPLEKINFSFFSAEAISDNSTREGATDIELDSTYNDSLLSSNDINWYKFTTVSDGCISIDFSREILGSTSNYWKVTVYAFEEKLEEISSTGFDGDHSTSTTEDIGLPAGDYYIAVEMYRYDFSDKTYTFSVNFTSSDFWEKELNNTFQTASAIQLNQGYSGSLSSSNDYDWYCFSVPADGYISIDFEREVLNNTTNYWKSTIYRISESIEEMASWSYDANHAKSTSPEIGLPTGSYYIKVERDSYYDSSKTYKMTVNYSSSDTWEKEFNSTFQTASLMKLNTSYRGSLYSSSDVDWYNFSTTDNGYVSIDFERSVMHDSTTYWKLTLYKMDESLQEMASWGYDGNHANSSTPEIGLPPGNYYFKIEQYSYYYSAETYMVNVNFKESEYWEKEFNNTFQTATEMNLNKSYNGSLYSSGDADWYKFDLNNNTAVEFNFTTDLIGDSDNHWELHLYKLTDTIDEINSWSISGVSSVTSISDVQLNAGTYYFKINKYSYYYSPLTYQLHVNDDTSKESIVGDISGNGKIDLYDAIEIAKYIIGRRVFTEEEKKIADINGDGTINLYDAIRIAECIVHNRNV